MKEMTVKKTLLCLMLGLGCALIQAQPRIELKTDLQDNSPKFMLDKGKASGICIDIFQLLESREGIRFAYAPAFVATAQIEKNIESGAADVHCGWVKNAQRERIATFGEDLFKVSYPGVVRANDKVDFQSLTDLVNLDNQGVVLGVNGTASTRSLQRIGGLQVDDSPKDAEQALKSLASGRGRIFIYQSLSIGYELQLPENKGRFKVVKLDYEGNKSFAVQGQAIVFSRKVPGETVARVNAAIQKHRADIDGIVRRYSGSL